MINGKSPLFDTIECHDQDQNSVLRSIEISDPLLMTLTFGTLIVRGTTALISGCSAAQFAESEYSFRNLSEFYARNDNRASPVSDDRTGLRHRCFFRCHGYRSLILIANHRQRDIAVLLLVDAAGQVTGAFNLLAVNCCYDVARF